MNGARECHAACEVGHVQGMIEWWECILGMGYFEIGKSGSGQKRGAGLVTEVQVAT